MKKSRLFLIVGGVLLVLALAFLHNKIMANVCVAVCVNLVNRDYFNSVNFNAAGCDDCPFARPEKRTAGTSRPSKQKC